MKCAKSIIVMIMLAIFILVIATASASDAVDSQLASEEAGVIELSNDDETIREKDNAQTQSGNDDAVGADEGTYTDLRNEIGNGGNITLNKSNYRYHNDGDTIRITTSGTIDGRGAVIDMTGSTIQALYVDAPGVTIRNLTFKNTDYDDNGGAICFSGSGTVENCNFVENAAKFGGAVCFMDEDGESIVTNCNFNSNNALYGGAVEFKGTGSVTNCNFNGNYALYEGGAIYFDGKGSVTNCNFAKNYVEDYGGAVYFFSEGDVTNCKFADNSAGSGGAIFSNQRYATADTCIFKTYLDTTVNTRIFPPALNINNFTTVYGSGDKLTFDLKTNGGMHLGNANVSIAIYLKGNDSLVANYSCLSGEGWIVDLPSGLYYAIFDAAYADFQPINRTITVVPKNTFWVLDNIINSNDDLVFDLSNDFYFDSSYDMDFVNGVVINRPVTINGNGHTIDANGKARIFNIESDNVVLDNIAFVNGNATGSGGAVYFNSSGTVMNCNFTDNAASIEGGAVFFLNNAHVTNCNFTGNNATTGSAIYFSSTSATKIVSNSIFLNNMANAEALEITKNDNNITITFTGNDNLLNAIYSNGDVGFTNVTYWSANGIANTDSSAPSRFNKEAGQNITVSVVVNDELVLNEVKVTDDNGMIVLPIIAGDNYYIRVHHDTNSYYTEAEKIISNIMFNVNVTSQTTHNKTVNITARSNIFSEIMDGKLIFIGPNNIEINASYEGNGIWWTVYTFDDYEVYQISASYIGFDNVTVNNATIVITKSDSSITIENVVLDYGESIRVPVETEGAFAIKAMIDGTDVVVDEFTIPISGLCAGNHTLVVTTIVDDDYNPVTKTVNITVNKIDSKLTVGGVELDYGESGEVTVTADGATSISAMIDGSVVGVDGFNITFFDLGVGTHVLSVTAIPDENHTAVTETSTITVNKLKTVLTANPVISTYKINRNMVIALKDSNGKALTGMEVTVSLNGAKTYITDNNGQIIIATKALGAKVYTAKITFNGNTNYDGSAKDVKVTVKKAENPLKVKGKTVKVKFKKLKKKTQKLKVKKVVKFTKKGVGSLTFKKVKGNKKIKVNKKTGKITIKKGLKKGTYKVKMKIRAKGNLNYKASSYKSVTFKIKVK